MTIEKDAQILKDSINTLLPAAPVVATYVTKAFELSEKYLSSVKRHYDIEDSMYFHALRVALTVTKRNRDLCTNDNWFDYEPTIIALLHDVIEDADSPGLRKDLQEAFGSYTGKFVQGIEALTNIEADLKAVGRSKYMLGKFNTLLRADKGLFAVKLADRIDNLTCLDLIEGTEEFKRDPKKAELFKRNYFMETFMITQSISNSGFAVHQDVYSLYNELSKIVTRNPF